MSKNKLKELFIEDLGKVTGGKKPPVATTLVVGEEDWNTTLAVGEEGETTHAEGEEDPYTTLALGEEGPLPA